MVLLSGAFAAAGVLLALLLKNWFLILPLALALGHIPFWIAKLARRKYDLYLADSLMGGLSLISTAYISKNNFIAAVESNIPYLRQPLQEVMQNFLTIVKMVNPSITAAVQTVLPSIRNDTWEAWCEIVIQCQRNNAMRPQLLTPIQKLSQVKEAQEELYTMLDKNLINFYIMLASPVLTLALLYLLMPSWGALLFGTWPGKLAIAVAVLVMSISTSKLIGLMQPLQGGHK